MMDKKILNEIHKKNISFFNKDRTCYYPGCKDFAINSHILMKNGILNGISNNNHLYRISRPNIFIENFAKFEKIGINDALTFKGFCPKHDHSIFKKVEDGNNLDYYDYNTQLLLSYRGILNELRKKEINKEFLQWIINSDKIKFIINKPEIFNSSLNGTLYGIKDIEFYKEILEKNIHDNSLKDFKFIKLDYPKLDICTSSFFSFVYNENLEYDIMFDSYYLPPAVIFNLIPTSTYLVILIGYLKKFESRIKSFINTFQDLTYAHQLKRLSDFLLLNIETWVCSPTLYETILKKNESKIIEIFVNSLLVPENERTVDFNMFQELII